MALRAGGRWARPGSALRGRCSGPRRAGDTPRHRHLREALRKIIDKEINPFVDKWEEEGQFPAHKVFKILGQAGFLGVDKPTEYGGMGLDFSYNIAVAEELGNVRCGAIPMAIGVQAGMATPALTRFGSHELKKQFLVPTIAGDFVACLGISEDGAGSDVATLTPMETIIQETIDYTGQRKVFGQPVLHNQTVHFRLAELATEVELLRSLLHRAVALYVEGNDVTKFASMAKLKAGRLTREVTDSCLQFWGGMGFTNEVLVSRFYRGKSSVLSLQRRDQHLAVDPGLAIDVNRRWHRRNHAFHHMQIHGHTSKKVMHLHSSLKIKKARA
ncbi:probable acyl-CoA dehydrogenase 6 isoform X6 [Taeniopygia guttata]|uniref:probable acyl-CoA dehydrogenase 6 isoform X6 n=1 Tax=Taeniopygia guttata TaxID=59729 RepID=UPI003BB88EF0